MRLLHTADLHLGRQFFGKSLADDHAVVLEQLLRAVETHRPDALIIAGDIFDRAAPPETAVGLFNDFLKKLADDTRTAIILIAGNHDSGERIEAMSMLADAGRALVRGALKQDEPVLVLHDAAGPVAISALPFAYEYAARECFSDPQIKAPADVVAAQITAAKARVPAGARWVVVAHAFVEGATSTDSERPLTRAVGGIETVPSHVFKGADYVALGHLHRPQDIGHPHIRYSGSPLAFGFDEEGQEKSMTVVDLAPDGCMQTKLIPFSPLRQVRTLTGTLDELLGDGIPPSDDFIQIMLTDPNRRIDPMKRLWERFPNACTLSYARLETKTADSLAAAGPDRFESPPELIGAFLEFTRGRVPTAAEASLIANELANCSTPGGDAE